MILKGINKFTNLKMVQPTEGIDKDVDIMYSCWETELTNHHESVGFVVVQIHAIQFCTAA